MDHREIHRKYGFDNSAIQNAIFTIYRPYIRKHLDSMFIDASAVPMEPMETSHCDSWSIYVCARPNTAFLLEPDFGEG